MSRTVDGSTTRLTTPRPGDLGLRRIRNESGLEITLLPNGGLFALEHAQQDRPDGRIMINQVLGSPIAGAMGGLWLRVGGSEPLTFPIAGARARGRIGAAERCFVWEGEAADLRHRVDLRLDPRLSLWCWHVEVTNTAAATISCDSILIQDLGLGERGFLMNNEAYASQYLDHFIARHARLGSVVMTRQNLAQNGRHPWVAHGCLPAAVGFATDFRQLLGPPYRDADELRIPFGTRLPSQRLQQETACSALQSTPLELSAGETGGWTFFGLFRGDHPAASADTDLALIDAAVPMSAPPPRQTPELAVPTRSLLLEAPVSVAEPLDEPELEARYPRRTHVERVQGTMLSFFTPEDTASRHIVLRDKERRVLRRHGTVLRSGTSMLPEETSLCTACWMHGVFGAQLAIGNTSFHRLFSVSRDPYNIGRGSGLRMLLDTGAGWRLLAVPSVFEIGLADCRWIYRLAGGRPVTITVSVSVSADEPAAQWRVRVEGEPCRFLVFCHLALGEREFEHAAWVELDAAQKRFSFHPDPQDPWGQRYPRAVYHLVTSTPESVEIAGGDELLYADGRRRSGAYAAMRTAPTREFAFAVVGSLTDPEHAASLAARYCAHVDEATMQARANRYWRGLTRGLRIAGAGAEPTAQAIETILPWLAHDAMIHLTVPQGLEQYSGAAWGTRDICQGPIELLLALGHDAPAAAILLRLFAQQYTPGGDWPQWFMLEPYADIRDRTSHGDVIVWPLKALCDYIEATGDFAILDAALPWRHEETLQASADSDPLAVHVERLIATVRERFVPGTHLIRYGNGDWNDSLQPVDASLRERMVSSWTVALLYEQLRRYAEILRRAGRSDGVAQDRLAAAMREDFNRLLVRDGVVAGYAVFPREGADGVPEVLCHPLDERTGVRYSLIPMTQAIIGGLFTPQQAEDHLHLIRERLTFPDGVRLMDRPIAYHGGPQALFQRAESAAFFGREIGLMYTHAHLRYAQAMGVLGLAREMWDGLVIVNPIAVTEQLAHATLRQRNTYFSSSDAAFADRYAASLEWGRVRTGAVAVDGGWRMYSSGPGIYTNLLVCQVFGLRRSFGVLIVKPALPAQLQGLSLEWSGPPARGSPPP